MLSLDDLAGSVVPDGYAACAEDDLRRILDAAHAVIDFHSTTLPSVGKLERAVLAFEYVDAEGLRDLAATPPSSPTPGSRSTT